MRVKPMAPEEGDWDRNYFATTGFELDYQDALNALERILQRPELRDGLRETVTRTANALRSALG